MSERHLQQQSHSSKVIAFFDTLASIHADAMARRKKFLVSLIVAIFTSTFACAPSASAASASTTTTLTVSSSSVTAGTVTTLTATVIRTAFPGPVITNVIHGQVVFCNANAARCDGAAVLGTAQMTASGTAQLKLILGVGTYSIKAAFHGFGLTPSSFSTAQAVTVTANSNYVSRSTIAATGTQGNYTLTGTVLAFGRVPATGIVSFLDTTAGNAVVGMATLSAGTLATVYTPAPQSPLPSAGGVQYVATGDFNNDGIPDLAWITASGGSSKVYVALGVGDGTFTAPANIALPNAAAMLVVADVNADGKSDLIIPNTYGGTSVTVLLGNGDGTFQPAQTFPAGTQPNFVAVGDFNGDGIPDLAVLNAGGKVNILLGAGDGTFAAPLLPANTVGSGPLAVVVGDFDNDGVLDLAVTNSNNHNVGILLGDGDGTFKTQTTIALPGSSQPYWLTTGDLRGTGVLDLVVPDGANISVYVLLGNNDGTFQTAVAYTPGDAGQGVALGDMNGDGILDLVFADTGEDGKVSVLLGVGNGTFSPRTDYTVGNGPLNVALADFNGDGMLDLADTDGQAGTVTVLLQGQTQTAIVTGVAAPGSGVQAVDASYPGDVERAASVSTTVPLTGSPTTETTTTTLTAAPNPVVFGQATILTATISPMPTGCSPFGTVSYYDGSTLLGSSAVNSSGVATLSISSLPTGSSGITAEYSGITGLAGSISSRVFVRVTSAATATVTLVLSGASVSSGAATTLTATVLNGVTQVTSGSVTFCDATAAHCQGTAIFGTAALTGNGTAALKLTFGVGTYSIDAVFTGDNALQGGVSAAHALTVTGAGIYVSGTTLLSSGSAGNYTLTSTVNAFGVAPLSGTVSFLDTSNSGALVGTATFNPATRTYGFIPTPDSPLSEPNGPENVVTGDFNNDGILDFAVVDFDTSTISVFIGLGNGAFQPAVTYATANPGDDLKVGDFNGDGKLDLVSVGALEGPTPVSVLLGNGDGTFQPEVSYSVGNGAISLAVGDFNGDGFQDLAVANTNSNTVSILLGEGNGTFQQQKQYTVGDGPFYVTTGDFNGDGVLDLAVVNTNDSTVSVLLGNGDGTFQAEVVYPVGDGESNGSPDYILAADFNKDGKLDLVTANYNDNTISILLGNGDGTFQAQVTYATGDGPNDLAIGDFNHDGNLDVAVSDNNDTTISMLYGNGDGTFQAPVIDDLAGGGPWGIASGDLNGDGLTDLLVTNNGDGTVSVLLNQQSDTAAATGVSVSGAGAHQVDASYPGDASRSGSVSDPVSLSGSTSVTTTTTTLVPSPSPAGIGQTVTLTATIAPAPTGAPLGTVSFYNGETLLGVGTVNASGVATFTTTGLPTGSNSLSAIYSGNSTSATSTSATVTETVAPLTVTATTVVLAPNPPAAGQAETFTATVSPAPTGASLGTVSFFNGATLLGMGTVSSSGVATFTDPGLPVGVATITAVYSGSATSATSTSLATVVTVTAGFTVVAPLAPIDAAQGGLITVPLTVPPLGGAFNSVVTMSATGLPVGAVAVFTPPTVTPGATGAPTSLTIQLAAVTAVVPSSDYRNSQWRGLALAFGLCVLCAMVLLRRGWPRKPRLILACTSLAVAALLVAGCNGGFTSPPFTPNGTYVITITGTSGLLHSSTTVTIVVK